MFRFHSDHHCGMVHNYYLKYVFLLKILLLHSQSTLGSSKTQLKTPIEELKSYTDSEIYEELKENRYVETRYFFLCFGEYKHFLFLGWMLLKCVTRGSAQSYKICAPMVVIAQVRFNKCEKLK